MLLPKDYLDMLKDYEQSMLELFDALAGRSWFKRKFWNHLGRDVRRHLEMIQDMRTRVEAGQASLKLKGFVGVDVVEARNFVLNLLHRVAEGLVGGREAMRRAAEIEQTAIEGDFYGILETDSRELRGIIDAMRAQAREHRDRLDREARRWF